MAVVVTTIEGFSRHPTPPSLPFFKVGRGGVGRGKLPILRAAGKGRSHSPRAKPGTFGCQAGGLAAISPQLGALGICPLQVELGLLNNMGFKSDLSQIGTLQEACS